MRKALKELFPGRSRREVRAGVLSIPMLRAGVSCVALASHYSRKVSDTYRRQIMVDEDPRIFYLSCWVRFLCYVWFSLLLMRSHLCAINLNHERGKLLFCTRHPHLHTYIYSIQNLQRETFLSK